MNAAFPAINPPMRLHPSMDPNAAAPYTRPGYAPTLPQAGVPGHNTRPRDWEAQEPTDKKRPRTTQATPHFTTPFPNVGPPPVPFTQRPNIAAPHQTIIPPHAANPAQAFAYAKPPFPHAQPALQPSLSQDRLPAPPRRQIPPSENATPLSQAQTDKPDTFKQFLRRQPDARVTPQTKQAYEAYIRELTTRNPNAFFDLHKHEEWFKERYDPDYVLSRCKRVQKECQDRAKEYIKLWRQGGSAVCAPDISAPPRHLRYHQGATDRASVDDMELPARPVDAAVSADTVEPRAEESDVGKPEDAMQSADAIKSETREVEMEDKHVGKEEGEDEGVEEKGADGQVKEEGEEGEFREPNEQEHLVDPAPKEEGVIEEGAIEEDTEGPKKEGEENKVAEEEKEIQAPVKKEETANAIHEEGKGDEHTGMTEEAQDSAKNSNTSLVLPLRREHQEHTIFMRGLPINVSRDDLTAVLANGPNGDEDLQLRRMKIGDINPNRSLQRFAWVVYADEDAASHALAKVKGVMVKTNRTLPERSAPAGESSDDDIEYPFVNDKDPSNEYVIDCMLNLERKKKYNQGRVLPEAFGTPERMVMDVDQSVKIMRFLDNLRKVEEECNPLTDEFLAGLPSDGQRLDHTVTYLREVHYYCYYSGNEFLEDATSMPPQEVRPTLRDGKAREESDKRMIKRVDERTRWVLDRDYDRPRSNSDHAETAKQACIQKWYDDHTVNESEGRYRCKLPPNKLFKAPEFVHKHLKAKHGDRLKEVVKKTVEDVYRANYENDASKADVVEIYNDGIVTSAGAAGGGSGRGRGGGGGGGSGVMRDSFGVGGMGQVRPAMPIFNPAAAAYMGMGMQPMPMMMMQPSGFSYPNTMNFGRGMNGAAVGGRMGGGEMGGNGGLLGNSGGKDMWRRPGGRGESGREFRDGGYHEGHHRGGHHHHHGHGHRGGRRGGSRRGGRGGGGGDGGRFDNVGDALDPRAMGPRRNYTDLDAPAKGPSFDIVRYDDI